MGHDAGAEIDVLATAISGKLSVEDLEELDLCYAPPFASAKDIVLNAAVPAPASAKELLGTLNQKAPKRSTK